MNRFARRQLLFWGLILGIWCLTVVGFTGQLMVARGWAWTQAMQVALHDWLPWAVLAPGVAWLSIQFPLERRKLMYTLPIHLIACALAGLLYELISRPIGLPEGPPPMEENGPRFRGPQEGQRRPFGPGPGSGPENFPPDRPRRPGDFPPDRQLPPDHQKPPPNGQPPERQEKLRDLGAVAPDDADSGGAQYPDRPDRPPRQGLGNVPRDSGSPGRFRPPEGFPGERQLLGPEGGGGKPALFHAAALKSRVNIPIYWVIVSIVHALTYLRRSQERERKALELEARLAEAKLQALRMQLHPHFLFNTLNAISTLVHRDPHAADEMIGNLSELLRATLDTSEPEIPLRQELSFLDRYLDIQQVRFGDRLRIEKEIDATALDALVPTLILQPLVENAVRHGIEPQTNSGKVRIAARHEGDVLELVVQDNGVVAKHAPKSREGIGLPNTRDRLQELYGPLARLTLTSASEGGFTVHIQLPYHESPVVLNPKVEVTYDDV